MIAVGGNEGLMRHHHQVFLVVQLLQQKVGAGREEGVRRLTVADDGDGGALLQVQAAEQVEKLILLRDRLPEVAEGVNQLLQMRGILGHAHVPLVQTAELSLQVDGAVKLVVVEEVVNAGPDGERRCIRDTHDVQDILGDGVVKPVDEALVDHHPFGVAAVSRGREAAMWELRLNLLMMESMKQRQSAWFGAEMSRTTGM